MLCSKFGISVRQILKELLVFDDSVIYMNDLSNVLVNEFLFFIILGNLVAF